ncbi:hypothetical protein [Pontibacter sp. SGAir0037]|uniref:hypothetical protein n=1 Tax=Pontibacter sp. SGAir0037 TaxID=2571030 RepID=UPI0010CCF7DC|nr:hypothetical protein [Pontibacter sp. SGAir0037]QCR24221.1 hypothetical protein C1N53_18915 [Pontibacter sp. SGAir0037]
MKKELLLVSLASMLMLSSCQVATMAVEPSFKEQAEEVPVAGRKAFKPNGNFAIGTYTVANVNRGWPSVGGFAVAGYENIKASQKHQFSLQDGKGHEWYVFGASKLHEKTLKSNNGISIAVAPNLEYYASHFTSPQSGQWHLLTTDPGQYLRRKEFEGELSNGEVSIKISPVYKAEGKKLPSDDILGYEFMQANERVAAVQVINNGKVWLKPGLSEDKRMVLTGAIASLLLYDKLTDVSRELSLK